MILSENYIIMEKTLEDDFELCFDHDNKQLITPSLDEARKLKNFFQDDYDNKLVIIRETQIVIE